MPLPVSVLDPVGMHPGEAPARAIARTVDLARHAEPSGYRCSENPACNHGGQAAGQ